MAACQAGIARCVSQPTPAIKDRHSTAHLGGHLRSHPDSPLPVHRQRRDVVPRQARVGSCVTCPVPLIEQVEAPSAGANPDPAPGIGCQRADAIGSEAGGGCGIGHPGRLSAGKVQHSNATLRPHPGSARVVYRQRQHRLTQTGLGWGEGSPGSTVPQRHTNSRSCPHPPLTIRRQRPHACLGQPHISRQMHRPVPAPEHAEPALGAHPHPSTSVLRERGDALVRERELCNVQARGQIAYKDSQAMACAHPDPIIGAQCQGCDGIIEQVSLGRRIGCPAAQLAHAVDAEGDVAHAVKAHQRGDDDQQPSGWLDPESVVGQIVGDALPQRNFHAHIPPLQDGRSNTSVPSSQAAFAPPAWINGSRPLSANGSMRRHRGSESM